MVAIEAEMARQLNGRAQVDGYPTAVSFCSRPRTRCNGHIRCETVAREGKKTPPRQSFLLWAVPGHRPGCIIQGGGDARRVIDTFWAIKLAPSVPSRSQPRHQLLSVLAFGDMPWASSNLRRVGYPARWVQVRQVPMANDVADPPQPCTGVAHRADYRVSDISVVHARRYRDKIVPSGLKRTFRSHSPPRSRTSSHSGFPSLLLARHPTCAASHPPRLTLRSCANCIV